MSPRPRTLAAWRAAVMIAGLVAGAPAVAGDGLAGLLDPTRPVDAAPAAPGQAPAAGGPILHSTIIAPNSRQAVIDGRLYRVGDRVAGAVITAIRPYEVELAGAGRTTTLRLVPALTKQMRPEQGQGNESEGVKP